MINEEYIFEPFLEIDYVKLSQIVFDFLEKNNSDKMTFEAHSNEYLVNIRKKYPFLSRYITVTDFTRIGELPPHIDDRQCTLNIPLCGTKNSITSFYKFKTNEHSVHAMDENKLWSLVERDFIEEDFSFTLLKPTILNVKKPHGVKKLDNERRVVVHWSIRHIDYKTLKNQFKSGVYDT